MPEPRYRALLIGNSTFHRDPAGLPELHGPKEDVKAVQTALADPDFGMFEDHDIEPLLDRRVQDLRVELEQFYLHDATRDDVLLLYYSGHGKLDVANRLHLCASDTRTSSLRSTALRYKEDVEEFIDESPAAATITVLDCCHSGGFRGGKLVVEATGTGRCVMTSSAADQLALDTVRLGGPSPFTEALTRGLRLAEAQLHLTTQELYAYVQTELGRPGHAKPQYYFDGAGSIILARRAVSVPAQASRPETLPAPNPEPSPEPVAVPADSETTRSGEAELEPEAPAPDWHLPPALNRLEHMLSKAVEAALSDYFGEADKEALLHQVVREAANRSPEWSTRLLGSIASGPTRQIVVEGLVAGLFDRDWTELSEFLNQLVYGSADYAAAHFAFANLLPESHLDLISESLDSSQLTSRHLDDGGIDSVPLLTRLSTLFLLAQAEEGQDGEFSESLLKAARAQATENPHMTGMLLDSVSEGIAKMSDPTLQQAYRIEAAREIGRLNPTFAASLLTTQFLSAEKLADIAIADLADLGISLLRVDHPLAFQMFEALGIRGTSPDDRSELLFALLSSISPLDSTDTAFLDRLFHEIERIADQQDDADLWQLSHFAEQLASQAPGLAERLLELDPDEDRRFASYLKVIRPANESGQAAAHYMAGAAERIARAIRSEEQRRQALLELAGAYAWVNPVHTIALLRSNFSESPHSAVESIAEAFALAPPHHLRDLARTIADHPQPDSLMSSLVKGIAPALPEQAINFALSIHDMKFRHLACMHIVTFAPVQSDAVSIALSEVGSGAQAEAAALLVQRLADADPNRAFKFADMIESRAETRHAKAVAFLAVARAVLSEDPAEAQHRLIRAARYAVRLDEIDHTRPDLLRKIAVELAAFNPGRAMELLEYAERSANTLPEPLDSTRTSALANIMIAWAPLVPANSERIATQIPEDWPLRDSRLCEAAILLAEPDPRRAEKVARMIGDETIQNSALLTLVKQLSTTSTARAERIAISLPQGESRARASLLVAKALDRSQTERHLYRPR